MSRRSSRNANWYALGWQTWLLGLEASCVIAARVSRIGAGDEAARVEFDRMFREKADACLQLQEKLLNMGTGATPKASMQTAVKFFRGKVAANRRRLSRPR